MLPFIANTDFAWFSYLTTRAVGGRVDEANFWSPRATRPLKAMNPGEPVFLRLKQPHHAIAGYGFFAHFVVLDLDDAWTMFGWKNGDPTRDRFLARIGGYRRQDLSAPGNLRNPLGCTLLRDVHFWPRERWIPWGDAEGWPRHVVQGKTESDPARASRLLHEIVYDAQEAPAEFQDRYEPVLMDERARREAETVVREGQGTFRARLLTAYRACAVTGEHSEPVLDAAHIQPYLGARSNHPQNGVLLTKEFHALFDKGFVTVTADYRVRVSRVLRERWNNGKRYYDYDGRTLATLPSDERLRPSRDALEWHERNVFVA